MATDTYIHAFVHTYIHTYLHTYIHTYIHTYTITLITYVSGEISNSKLTTAADALILPNINSDSYIAYIHVYIPMYTCKHV